MEAIHSNTFDSTAVAEHHSFRDQCVMLTLDICDLLPVHLPEVVAQYPGSIPDDPVTNDRIQHAMLTAFASLLLQRPVDASEVIDIRQLRSETFAQKWFWRDGQADEKKSSTDDSAIIGKCLGCGRVTAVDEAGFCIGCSVFPLEPHEADCPAWSNEVYSYYNAHYSNDTYQKVKQAALDIEDSDFDELVCMNLLSDASLDAAAVALHYPTRDKIKALSEYLRNRGSTINLNAINHLSNFADREDVLDLYFDRAISNLSEVIADATTQVDDDSDTADYLHIIDDLLTTNQRLQQRNVMLEQQAIEQLRRKPSSRYKPRYSTLDAYIRDIVRDEMGSIEYA